MRAGQDVSAESREAAAVSDRPGPGTRRRVINTPLYPNAIVALDELIRWTARSQRDVVCRAITLLHDAERAHRAGAEVVYRYPNGDTTLVRFL
jgi:hypothetical protein